MQKRVFLSRQSPLKTEPNLPALFTIASTFHQGCKAPIERPQIATLKQPEAKIEPSFIEHPPSSVTMFLTLPLPQALDETDKELDKTNEPI